jgi:hypothetical protein
MPTDRTGAHARLNLILLSLILCLFLAGFLLGEDALGGGIRSDLYTFHGPTIQAFRDHPWSTVLPDYNSATTPLFHLLESLNPTFGHDTPFRASNLLIALLTVVLFTLATLRRFPPERAAVLLIGASILLSPYYRAEAYWASTDILPIFFLALTALLLIPATRVPHSFGFIERVGYRLRKQTTALISPHNKNRDVEQIEEPVLRAPEESSPYLLISLLALTSWSAFYTRQTYLFAPAYAGILLLVRYKRERWFTFLLFAALAIPAIDLVHLWHGLVPPHFQHHEKLSINGVVAPLSMIFLYAIPFLIEAAIARDRSSAGLTTRSWLAIGSAWILFLAVFRTFRFDEQNRGGGIAAKILSHLGTPGAFLFLTIGFLGLLVTAWLFRVSTWRGRLLIVLFLIPDFAMSEFYQRYFDPLLVVLFFLFLDRAVVRPFVRPRMASLLIAFNALLLAGALVYNVHSPRPEFLPLNSATPPWTLTNPQRH